MRALAFPGEEPESVKAPDVVAEAILRRLTSDAPTCEKVRVEAWLKAALAQAGTLSLPPSSKSS